MKQGLFFAVVFGFAIGIFVHSRFEIPPECIVVTGLLSFCYGVLWRRGGASFCIWTSVFFLSCTVGLIRVEHTNMREPFLTKFEGVEVVGEGVVVREPDVRATTQHLYVRELESDELLLITTDAFLGVSYGDAISFQGVVEKPVSFETDLGQTFEYGGYLRARGVRHAIFFGEVSVLEEGRGNKIIASLLDSKHRFMRVLESAIPEPQAGLSEGLLLGVKRALGEDLEESFRVTGIIHIVVLSGYNIMLIAEAMMRLLSFVFLPRMRMVLGVVAISAFALMVGLTATVVRASIMAILVLVARATGRTYAIVRALMLAGIVMVFLNPYLLAYDPGFQLSFLATLGLILVAPHLEKLFVRVPTTLQVREFVVATIATQIMVLPLLLYTMGLFSTVSVFVNVLVLPMVPVAMALSFVTGIVGLVSSTVAEPIAFVAYLSLSYITSVATLFARIPFAGIEIPAFPFLVTLILYGVIAYILYVRFGERVARKVSVRDDLRDFEIVPIEEIVIRKKQDTHDERPASFPFR